MFFQAVDQLVLLAAVAAVAGFRLPQVAAWALAAAGVVAFGVEVSGPADGGDLHAFWTSGANVWDGTSPYDVGGRPGVPVPLNPPTAFPLFAAFALLPFDECRAAWTALNAAACLALAGLSARTLRAVEPGWALDRPTLALLSVAVALSFAACYGIRLGQLAILSSVLLVGAVYAGARGRWAVAAACLALATVKVGTMLPFLLLFTGRGHRKTLAAVAVVCLALVLAATPVAAVPARLHELAGNIARLDVGTNNYEYANPSSVELYGIDHALYRVGLRDRGLVRLGQGVALAVLGAWVAFETSPKGRLPRGAAVCLVALYSQLFLYHRAYDAVLLALPLVYFAGRTGGRRGWAKLLPLTGVFAVLDVMYLRVQVLGRLTVTATSPDAGSAGVVTEAVVLPYATWLVLLAMACLGLMDYRPDAKPSSAEPGAAP